MTAEERELKLVPADAALLEALWQRTTLGPFTLSNKRTEHQRNSFFDSRDRGLSQARLGFRRRTIDGQPMATWTLKAEGDVFRGISTRPEIELRLGADMPPALALGALRQAAQHRGAGALAEQLADALAVGGLPLVTPVLESETVRFLADLVASDDDWRAELALDNVRLLHHARHTEVEIEVELDRGPDDALDAARAAIEAVGSVRESQGTKLSRALEHVAGCAGC
jgi:inorganic triphosphatase YgiF